MRHLVLGLVMAFLLVSNQAAANGTAPVAYLSNSAGPNVLAVDTSSPTPTPTTIPVGTTTYGVAVGPKGDTVYVTGPQGCFPSPGTLYVIDTAKHAATPVTVGWCPRGVAVSHDGSWVYVANFLSRTVSVINAVTKTVVKTITGFGGFPWGVTVSPVDNRLYVTTWSGTYTVLMVDIKPNQPTTNQIVAGVPNLGGQPVGIAVSPDGTCLYAADNQSSPSGRVWVIKTNLIGDVSVVSPVVATVTVGPHPFGVDITPDGKHVYVSNGGSNTVSVIDIDPTAGCSGVSSLIPVGDEPQGVSVSSDGSTVYVANFMSSNLTAISVATKATRPISPKNLLFPIAFGHFVTPITVITVKIDVVPQKINLKAQGTVPIKIFGSLGDGGSDPVDVYNIDLSTVCFNGWPVKQQPNGEWMANFGDFNGDGVEDVMVHVDMTGTCKGVAQNAQRSPGTATVMLEGQTKDGIAIQGTTTVTFLP